ncbi:MAG: recA [Polyangiaceae bacterium]|nr:recA [Polyangiaceae bacterium]
MASLFGGCYYVQYMALPAHVLERLSPAFTHGGVRLAKPAEGPAQGLSFGIPELDALLPDGGLLRGSVVELSAAGEGALGTSLCLAACAQAQAEARARGAHTPWCAFVDPSGTLYGPGVAAAGVELERLLVVRPSLTALSRVALACVARHLASGRAPPRPCYRRHGAQRAPAHSRCRSSSVATPRRATVGGLSSVGGQAHGTRRQGSTRPRFVASPGGVGAQRRLGSRRPPE